VATASRVGGDDAHRAAVLHDTGVDDIRRRRCRGDQARDGDDQDGRAGQRAETALRDM
jgi:hypothetical protein